MSESVTIECGLYWKMKCLMTEAAAYQQQAQRELEAMHARTREAMVAAGLDPLGIYRLDDVALTATLQPPA